MLDLALLSEWPDAVGMIFGDGPDSAGATADDFLGALSGSMPFEYIVHVDSDDIIRRILVVVDIGAILSQVFGELALADDFPEDAEGAFPEFDYVMSMQDGCRRRERSVAGGGVARSVAGGGVAHSVAGRRPLVRVGAIAGLRRASR